MARIALRPGNGAALALFTAICCIAPAYFTFAAVTIATVPVGDAGNTADSTGYGAVGYNYSIDKYDVTIAQYTAFLNAVAATDPNKLYSTGMYNPVPIMVGGTGCGISRSGSPGTYTYTITRNPNLPVNNVNYWTAVRFANWLHNGQPTGAQGPGTTEDGAYTLTATGISNNTVVRNAGATWAIPTEDEWYKAAYYNPANSSYYLYPTQSNTVPSNAISATGTNNANYFVGNYSDPLYLLTPVGAFAASPSAYGTFDQGGLLDQWTETIHGQSIRGLRGGSYGDGYNYLQSSLSNIGVVTSGPPIIGFRVAQVPEPRSLAILSLASVFLFRRARRAGGLHLYS